MLMYAILKALLTQQLLTGHHETLVGGCAQLCWLSQALCQLRWLVALSAGMAGSQTHAG